MDRTAHESVWIVDNETLNRCELTHLLEKRAVLQRLSHDRTELALHFMDLAETIPTTILSFSQTGEQLTVDGSKQQCLKVLEAGIAVRLQGSHNGIQLIIEAAFQGLTDQNALPILTLKGPSRIIRLQRREFFRIAAPVLAGPQLRISQPLAGMLEVSIIRALDLSRGGLALEIPSEFGVKIDDVWKNCTLILPASGEVEFSLHIRSITSFSLSDGSKRLRIGCKYLHLHELHGQMIEQYVLRMQRDQVASERGWARDKLVATPIAIKRLYGR